jgi:hypothetical protein
MQVGLTARSRQAESQEGQRHATDEGKGHTGTSSGRRLREKRAAFTRC